MLWYVFNSYMVTPAIEVGKLMMECLVAPFRLSFEILIRYIEVEGWYVILIYPFILAFYAWIFSLLAKAVTWIRRKLAHNDHGNSGSNRNADHGAGRRVNSNTQKAEEESSSNVKPIRPWYAYDPEFEELYDKYCRDK